MIEITRATLFVLGASEQVHITNSSAYVVKALKAFPEVRNKDGDWGTAHRAFIAAEMLDENVQEMLEEADAGMALTLLDQLASKREHIRNPSAFVAKALQENRRWRGGRKGKM